VGSRGPHMNNLGKNSLNRVDRVCHRIIVFGPQNNADDFSAALQFKNSSSSSEYTEDTLFKQ
jgi:hypothetical protein